MGGWRRRSRRYPGNGPDPHAVALLSAVLAVAGQGRGVCLWLRPPCCCLSSDALHEESGVSAGATALGVGGGAWGMGGPSARGRGRDPPGGSRRSGVWGSWAEGGRHSFMSGVVGPRCFFNPAPARRGEVPCGPSALCLPAVWGAEAFAAWQPSRSCSTTRQSAAASAGNPRPDARLPLWRSPPTAKATAGPPPTVRPPRRPCWGPAVLAPAPGALRGISPFRGSRGSETLSAHRERPSDADVQATSQKERAGQGLRCLLGSLAGWGPLPS